MLLKCCTQYEHRALQSRPALLRRAQPARAGAGREEGADPLQEVREAGGARPGRPGEGEVEGAAPKRGVSSSSRRLPPIKEKLRGEDLLGTAELGAGCRAGPLGAACWRALSETSQGGGRWRKVAPPGPGSPTFKRCWVSLLTPGAPFSLGRVFCTIAALSGAICVGDTPNTYFIRGFFCFCFCFFLFKGIWQLNQKCAGSVKRTVTTVEIFIYHLKISFKQVLHSVINKPVCLYLFYRTWSLTCCYLPF